MPHKSMLGYLKKKGQTNTFRLARDLGIDRHKLLNILKGFEEKGAIELKSGTVKFLKFPEKVKRVAKKIIEVKKALSAPKKRIKHKETENKEFKERFLALEKTIKELQQKASAPPKIIRRTIVKNIIKKVPVERIETKPKKFKMPKFIFNLPKINFGELNKHIQQLHVPEILRKKEVF